MNSRSGVNETNLVNFPNELTALNQLEAKDGLLSFSFDHIYACHSGSGGDRRTLELDKEVEISTHCVVAGEELVPEPAPDVSRLLERLATFEAHNKKLKELLVYHLDLIQQQNEFITKRDKLFQSIKQENDTLKSRLNRMDRRVNLNQRQSTNPPPLVNWCINPTPAPKETTPASSQLMLHSLTELVLPENIFDTDSSKSIEFTPQEPFEVQRNSEKVSATTTNYLQAGITVPQVINKVNCNDYKMIENKRLYVKKEIKTENRTEALYSVTGNSANPVFQRIQRNRRRTTGTSSLSRAPKSTAVKLETSESSNPYEAERHYDRNFTVNKKSKMINTYGKCSRNGSQANDPPKKTLSQFTGSLSDRLQLIDTTPTGEDPYQLGEADMREQSPIPKLMLQKTNQGRMKICSTDTSSQGKNFYESPSLCDNDDNSLTKIKLNKYNLPNTYMHPSEIKKEEPDDSGSQEPDLDIVKTEPEIDWRIDSMDTSLCDFSYGEGVGNLASHILPELGNVSFQDLFSSESSTIFPAETSRPAYHSASDKGRRGARTTSLVDPNTAMCGDEMPKSPEKGGRKRALSTTGLLGKTVKKEQPPKPLVAPKPKPVKGKAACRGKKSPMPGKVTNLPYHTLVGDPDTSWYLGLDSDMKHEDAEQVAAKSAESTVEVPRWREKPFTSCHSLEGTESLDDKVFEKRHQKLEAEERRQLRWHMRRVREQRHVERLRQRQRDTWYGGATSSAPATFTVWPRPQSDARSIEITDTLPVTAFGEDLPDMPETDFVLPWVRTSKAQKRSKRSKTLH